MVPLFLRAAHIHSNITTVGESFKYLTFNSIVSSWPYRKFALRVYIKFSPSRIYFPYEKCMIFNKISTLHLLQCPMLLATDYRRMLFQMWKQSLCSSPSLPPLSRTAYLLDPNLAEYLMRSVTYLMSDELPAIYRHAVCSGLPLYATWIPVIEITHHTLPVVWTLYFSDFKILWLETCLWFDLKWTEKCWK